MGTFQFIFVKYPIVTNQFETGPLVNDDLRKYLKPI